MSEAFALDYPAVPLREPVAAVAASAPLPLFLVGLNHRTAPLEIRERLSVPESKTGACCSH